MSSGFKDNLKDLLRPIKQIYQRIVCSKRNKKLVQGYLRRGDVKLELGAGCLRRPGWISIDLTGADINIDLTKSPLPFPDASIERIYSSHVFEHFSYPEPMLSIFRECYRCLKPGGIFDISVPNAAMYVDAYNCGKYPKGTRADPHLPAYHNNSKMDILNYTAYMAGAHKHMFDLEGLLAILEKSGFKNPNAREYDPGMDLEVRRWESIYAIASK